jgi:SAM-dependent methyltransferase
VSEYIYDPSLEEEQPRLRALESILDPGTFAVLETVGVSKGWRCLEIGGGGGSVTRWLCDRVGRDGHVVATDLDTRFLEEIASYNLEVRKHNIVTEPIEEGTYDLVHSRDVLEHIPEREIVLDKMVSALKPGGWLVAEDVDFMSSLRIHGFGEAMAASPSEKNLWKAVMAAMNARGVDPDFGRRLPWQLVARGLKDVDATLRGGFAKAHSTGGTLEILSVSQFRPMLIEAGLAEDDFDQHLSYMKSDDFMRFGPIHIAAWGRKTA